MVSEIQPEPKCSMCGEPTRWGNFSLTLGETTRSHSFCEDCFRKFARANTMVLLLLNKFFPGIDWRKDAPQKSEMSKLRQ
jgi:hypothetical protein